MEIKIPKEVRGHQEAVFFGLSLRQLLCAALAVALAAGCYLGLMPVLGRETASWLCILAARPAAIAGFFRYNGMNLEEFLWAFVKSQLLRGGKRPFRGRNLYYDALGRKEKQDFD